MHIDTARKLVQQDNGMSAEEATALLDLLMEARLSPEEGAELLRHLAARGETASELAAFVRGLLQRAIRIPWDQPCADCCGTGGSGRSRFNVSTTAAIIAATAGVPVAKHGNKGSRQANGSFDLLEALGLPLNLAPALQAQLLRDFHLTFCFARAHHPAVAAVVPYRQAAGGRSIFNLAGPLANPAGAGCQIIGVCDPATARVIAEGLQLLGHRQAVVVQGAGGWDEFVLDGDNTLIEVSQQGLTERVLPAPFPDCDSSRFPGGDCQENLRIFQALLAGDPCQGLVQLVCFAAGALIDTWHQRPISAQGPGMQEAESLLASGAVKAHFEAFRSAALKG